MAKQPQTDLAALREQIATAKIQLETIRRAPLPLAEALAAHQSLIERMAAKGREHLERMAAACCHPDTEPQLLPAFDARHIQHLIAALHGDALLAHGAAVIERQFGAGQDVAPVSAADREAELRRAEGTLLQLERDEEMAIVASGAIIPRRPDANPAAVLGVEPGAPLPWTFRSAKAEALRLEAEATRNAMDQLRAAISGTQQFLGQLLTDAAEFQGRQVPATLAADIEQAERALADQRQQLADRQAELSDKNRLAARLGDYIKKHRTARPSAAK